MRTRSAPPPPKVAASQASSIQVAGPTGLFLGAFLGGLGRDLRSQHANDPYGRILVEFIGRFRDKVLDVECLSHIYLTHIDPDAFGYFVWKASHGESSLDEIDLSAFLNTYGISYQLHDNFHGDWLIEGHFIEIDVEKAPPVRVGLNFANEHLPVLAAIDLKVQELALAAGLSEKLLQM
jgi:hypothetical protein